MHGTLMRLEGRCWRAGIREPLLTRTWEHTPVASHDQPRLTEPAFKAQLGPTLFIHKQELCAVGEILGS
eukprot:2306263-Amphidinium_carterae.1